MKSNNQKLMQNSCHRFLMFASQSIIAISFLLFTFSPALSQDQPRVAVFGADGFGGLPDIEEKILATGLVDSVATFNISIQVGFTPTLADLMAFDAVLVYYWDLPHDPVKLGNALADYIDAGGGVVIAEYALVADPFMIQGRFNSDNYWAIQPTGLLTTGPETLGEILVPNHPILDSVKTFNGGTASFRPTAGSIHPQATEIARWSDGSPLVVEREINGVKRVDLGFFPVSSDFGSGSALPKANAEPAFWDSSTDGGLLIIRTLLQVSGFSNILPPPNIAASPDPLQFPGIVPVGSSAKAILNIANTGGADLVVENITFDDPTKPFTVSNPAFTVAPGDTEKVEITFTPAASGLAVTVLNIFSNDPDTPVRSLSVSGTGGVPDIDAVSSFSFISIVPVGEPRTSVISIANRGTIDLAIQNISTDNTAFSVAPTSLTIAKADSKAVNITFTPTKAGLDSTLMTIVSNDPDEGEFLVKVFGIGGVPDIDADTSLVFQDTLAIGQSDTLKLRVFNNGNVTLIFTDVISSNPEFFVTNSFPTEIRVDGTEQPFLDLEVVFKPTGLGSRMGTLTLISNDPDEPEFLVKVSGTVSEPDIDADSSFSFIFPVPVGEQRTGVILIANRGTTDLIIQNISTDNPAFTVTPASLTIAKADTDAVDITFTPTKAGLDSTLITIVSNDPDEGEFLVKVFGIGGVPDIDTDTSLVFNTIAVGDSASLNLRIFNVGNADLVVKDLTSSNPVFIERISQPGATLPHTIPAKVSENFIDVLITFKPDEAGEFLGQFIIVSNDPDEPEFRVQLRGKAVTPKRTRQEIADMVNEFVDMNVPNPERAEGFLVQQPLPPGTNLQSFKPAEFNTATDSLAWFAWVLERSGEMRFVQPGHFIWIDDEDASLRSQAVEWWPVIDGEPYLSGIDERQNTADRIRGTPQEPEIDTNDLISDSSGAAIPSDSVCAVLVSGKGNDETEQKAFNFDVRVMQGNLTIEKLGPRLPVANTRLLLNTSPDEVCAQLESMKDKYKKIYFYYSGHGDSTAIILRGDFLLYIELAKKLYDTRAPELCVILDNCKAGAAKSKFQFFSDYARRNITLITSSSKDSLSYTRFLQNTATGSLIRASAFTWHFARCFGDPAADANNDGETTLPESYRWLRQVNPKLRVGPMNDLMDPQICQNRVVKPDSSTIALADLDLEIKQNVPLQQEATLRVELGPVEGLTPVDPNVESVWPRAQWNIETENQTQPFKVDLKFSYRGIPDEDFPNGSKLVIVRRDSMGVRWQVYEPVERDEANKTITALGVFHFSDWAFAFVSDTTATGVASDGNDGFPQDFVLRQNYPNPFNPATTIQFALPTASYVTLKLFDLRGGVVATLVDENLAAGQHQVVFDASGLTSGVYFYRMQAKNFQAIKKFSLIK